MPQFSPSEAKTAIAPITVSPSGLSCEAELFLGPDELTKVATSGRRPFSSTGASQSVRLPITIPSAEGTYHAYIDVYAGGLLIAAYQAIEDVVITAVTPPATVLAGVILDVKWRETGTEEWRPFPVSLPAYTRFDCKWRVRNDSNGRATFTTGIFSMNYYRAYGQTVTTLDPGEEADLIYIGFAGFSAGTSGSQVIYLGALPGTVTETGQQYWYKAKLVDSVTLHYSWY